MYSSNLHSSQSNCGQLEVAFEDAISDVTIVSHTRGTRCASTYVNASTVELDNPTLLGETSTCQTREFVKLWDYICIE